MHILDTFLIHYLHRFDKYCFTVDLHDKKYTIGSGQPLFNVVIHKDIPKRELLSSTSLALGEAYMRKDLEIEGDLFTALQCILSQTSQFSLDKSALKRILYTPESKSYQKQQVSSHYDLGNDFYQLWLDPSMSYSCAYFKQEDDTLEQAQHNKVHYILEKLHLQPGMSLLDIGCGWGFLLIEAAKKYKIKGMGITLSHEQYAEFNRRIEKLNLQDYLTVKLMDYRDLPKTGRKFDRVVSVGMVEHVGRENYRLFNDSVKSVLKKGGMFLLHYISQLKEDSGNGWMQKYIFPGGELPSLREMVDIMAEEDFHILDIENLRRHYNKTLLCWDRNFHDHINEIKNMFDERFIRMWDLYLAGCAAAFYTGVIEVHQILVTNGVNNDLPITRWY